MALSIGWGVQLLAPIAAARTLAAVGAAAASPHLLLRAPRQHCQREASAPRLPFSSHAAPGGAAAPQSPASSGPAAAAATAGGTASSGSAAPAAAGAAAAAGGPGGPSSRKLNFDDPQAVFSRATLGDLVRAYVVLSVCSFDPLVRNAESLLRAARRYLGDGITFAAIRPTFFKQFCAGETERDIWPAIRFLQANGVRAIIDFAAEDDVDASSGGGTSDAGSGDATATTASGGAKGAGTAAAKAEAASRAATAAASSALARAQGVVGRVYRYEDEAACDRHVGVFRRAIETAGGLPGPGFAAIKVTALGNPLLLERMSGALTQVRELFVAGDTDGDRTVDAREFSRLFRQLLPRASDDHVARAFAVLDLEKQGRVDIVDWTNRVQLSHFPALAEQIKQEGSKTDLSKAYVSRALSGGEVELADAMLGRVGALAAAAAEANVRLMVDAEHTYFQPAIDHTAKALSLQYNVERPIIFNTYQAYLKGSYTLLMEDMERARRNGYKFGAKLVRGAYMTLERRRAEAKGYPSPIWDTLQETHDNYNRCMRAVLREVKESGAELMIASHNQESIELAVGEMERLGLPPSGGGVYFGQLLGMADALTFTLGQNGYDAFKYVPYGPIAEVLPYLVRRAQENSAVVQGAAVARQMAMLRSEIARRALQAGRA